MSIESAGMLEEPSRGDADPLDATTGVKQPTRPPPPSRPVVVNDATAPSSAVSLRDLWLYRELLWFLAWRDIKVRYKQTVMGTAWAIIQPLLMALVFAVFFGLVIAVPTDGMPHAIFFYCGIMPYTFLSTALSAGSISLINNSNLVTKIYFPRTIVPIATIGAGLLDLLITIVILLGMVIFYRMPWTFKTLMLAPLLLLTIWLATSLGIWLAALTVKYRDIRHALPFVIQMWMFVTPIIYPLSVIPANFRQIIYLNPLTGISEGIRSAVAGRDFNWTALGFSVVISFFVCLGSIHTFKRIEKSFADLI